MLPKILRLIVVYHSLFIVFKQLTLCWPNIFRKKSLFKFPTVILISFDGFRWDYLERITLKSFKYIVDNGVKAKSLRSSFITKTFPNHFTLVTGLYEESHGIIASKMYDPLYNETFETSTTESKWWNASVPIWIQNELQYKETVSVSEKKEFNYTENDRKSAAIFWVGSNVKYKGKLPYFYKPVYNSSFSFQDRFRLITSLLKEQQPANFIACYFHEPDATAHKYGPESENVNNVLRSIDNLLGEFLEDLERHDFLPHVNIVLVSDHGMTSIEPEHQIVLDDFVDRTWYTAVDINVFASLVPKENYTTKLYRKLKNIPHLTTFMKKEIPDQLHYKNHRRVPPIFAIAEEGYIIKQKKENSRHIVGNHGYSDSLKSMHGIFLAMGPAFKRRYIGDTFRNIHIYEMLCHILDIKPSQNNGSFAEIEHYLAYSQQKQLILHTKMVFEIVLVCVVSLVLIVSLCCYFKFKRHSMLSAGYVMLSEGNEGMPLDIMTEDLSIEKSNDEDEF